MKKRKLYSAITLLMLLAQGCSNSEPREVLRSGGAFRAYVDEVDSEVAAINHLLPKMERLELDSTEMLSTEYPYWGKMYVYLDSLGIRKAAMYADYDNGKRTEELYFRGGELIYANLDENGLLSADTMAEEFYFAREELIFALDGHGKEWNVEIDTVKIASIDLVKEARKFRELIAEKDLTP